MTAPAPPNNPKRAVLRHLRPSDLRAAAQLASQATQGVINITEGVHQSVRRRLGLSSGASAEQASGLTGQIYQGIRGVAHIVGHGLDGALAALLPLVDDPATYPEASPAREAVLAALNGVLGDRLQSFGNPLAQTMELRQGGQALPLAPEALKAQLGEQASPHLLLLAHGLCMNDTQWRRSGHDHGEFLAQALGCTPVYLRYNSGLHTSTNGRELALLLERLAAAWPVPLARITIVGHSMGGLVARSAVQVAREAGQRWPGLLRELVFLGTPHHGAPLERAGHGVDLLLASSPHTAPFARLGKIRSAGITDLRHGHVLDADWQGRDRFGSSEDHRLPLPLPEGVACFTVAATLAGQRGLLAARLTGDGLVPLNSALGQHDDPARRLVFAKDSQHIVYRTGHLDLLSSDKVAAQLVTWLR
ncbi:MAG: alpha/beta hydrolase [Hydrogenophaga sp.]|uniref:lipase family alpha/beta hydrolase n=1 Tax=Hydrogenophaga aromaticivorans TaxID=2610898 RepID=UPI001B3976B4|nr:alpha/beta hydrolase [Hydrogenophaga aromaticivorans]MBQ0919172.1 alpha/beta hydrolase [Hydrogenophaga aromaticivorans]MDO9293367.1 alpha/beta hydrolase [Hydrogenophaga sp.]